MTSVNSTKFTLVNFCDYILLSLKFWSPNPKLNLAIITENLDRLLAVILMLTLFLTLTLIITKQRICNKYCNLSILSWVQLVVFCYAVYCVYISYLTIAKNSLLHNGQTVVWHHQITLNEVCHSVLSPEWKFRIWSFHFREGKVLVFDILN